LRALPLAPAPGHGPGRQAAEGRPHEAAPRLLPQVPLSFLAVSSEGRLQEAGWMKQPRAMHLGWAAQWLGYEGRLRERLARLAVVVPVFADEPVLRADGSGSAATVRLPAGTASGAFLAWPGLAQMPDAAACTRQLWRTRPCCIALFPLLASRASAGCARRTWRL
jgi:hypothetical protein